MADVSQTAANVKLLGEDQYEERVQFGESVSPGDWLYLKSTDRKYWKAKHDGTTEQASVKGMSLCYAAADQYGYIAKPGASVNVGATLTAGQVYAVSNTAGKMCPYGDLGTGDNVTTLGLGSATGTLTIKIDIGGVKA